LVWDAGAASQIPISYERTERRQEDLNLIQKTQETPRKIAAGVNILPVGRPTSAFGRLLFA